MILRIKADNLLKPLLVHAALVLEEGNAQHI